MSERKRPFPVSPPRELDFDGAFGSSGSRVVRRKRRFRVAASCELEEGKYKRQAVLYGGAMDSVVVFRLGGVCRAFRNRCVHMPRELDGESKTIFDDTGKRLRCSMHGIVFDPVCGASLSTMCEGQRLTEVRIEEEDGEVWIVDKKVRPLAEPISARR